MLFMCMHTHAHTHTHSFDHDGLGRYGDRLQPDGDLLAMQTVAAVLQDQGLLFLTVPVGEYIQCCLIPRKEDVPVICHSLLTAPILF